MPRPRWGVPSSHRKPSCGVRFPPPWHCVPAAPCAWTEAAKLGWSVRVPFAVADELQAPLFQQGAPVQPCKEPQGEQQHALGQDEIAAEIAAPVAFLQPELL